MDFDAPSVRPRHIIDEVTRINFRGETGAQSSTLSALVLPLPRDWFERVLAVVEQFTRDWEESSYGLVAHRLAARGAATDSAEPTVGTSKLLEFLN
jgi:hypothetical protein